MKANDGTGRYLGDCQFKPNLLVRVNRGLRLEFDAGLPFRAVVGWYCADIKIYNYDHQASQCIENINNREILPCCENDASDLPALLTSLYDLRVLRSLHPLRHRLNVVG